jgi:hypothetical protein
MGPWSRWRPRLCPNIRTVEPESVAMQSSAPRRTGSRCATAAGIVRAGARGWRSRPSISAAWILVGGAAHLDSPNGRCHEDADEDTDGLSLKDGREPAQSRAPEGPSMQPIRRDSRRKPRARPEVVPAKGDICHDTFPYLGPAPCSQGLQPLGIREPRGCARDGCSWGATAPSGEGRGMPWVSGPSPELHGQCGHVPDTAVTGMAIRQLDRMARYAWKFQQCGRRIPGKPMDGFLVTGRFRD